MAAWGDGGRGEFFAPRPGWVRTAHVHDPSVFMDRDGRFYIVGTHLASAESDNLISWRQTSTLRDAIAPEEIEKIRAWNDDAKVRRYFDYLWAPDVIYNPRMRKYCIYLSANGDRWKSNIVMLAGDAPTGPFRYQGTVVYGGFSEDDWRQTDLAQVLRTKDLPERYIHWGVENNRWGQMFPNAIDPCVFFDDAGALWMSYGSWSGGIFLLALDPKTGLRDTKTKYSESPHSDPYFGRLIAGGRYVSGEGSYIRKIGPWYWLFISYGKLEAKGGYNVRVFRSARPEGPYTDRLGNTPFYDVWRENFNDGIGVRLFGAYRWPHESEGMVAQGHNSAIVDDKDRAFIVYHTRTTAGHEGHYIRVHQLFLNKAGWLVAAPFKFRGESLPKKGVPAGTLAGEWNIIMHRLEVDYANLGTAQARRATLHRDGRVSGAFKGRWAVEKSTPYFTIRLEGEGGDTFRGVALIQAIDSTNTKTPVFTALGDNTQIAIWGAKIAEP